MRDEACRSFRDGSAGGRCTGVDGVPPVSPLSTGQAPQRQGRSIEAAQLQDAMRPTSLRANDCATPGTEQFPPPSPKSQTASPTTTHCQHLSPRRSALWAPHHLESQPHRHPAGELHYMRVRHAGDTLCDCLVSCKTPTTASMEGARRLQDRAQCPLARKYSPSTGLPTALARKNSPGAPENSLIHPFQAYGANFFALTHTPGRAGRTFSRLNETATAFASSFTGAHETSDAFARPQCPKIKHFARAKVPAVSPHHEDRAAMAPAVSDQPHTAPNRQAMHRLTHHCTSY